MTLFHPHNLITHGHAFISNNIFVTDVARGASYFYVLFFGSSLKVSLVECCCGQQGELLDQDNAQGENTDLLHLLFILSAENSLCLVCVVAEISFRAQNCYINGSHQTLEHQSSESSFMLCHSLSLFMLLYTDTPYINKHGRDDI